MDRLEAQIEYERILNDAVDWLRDGYRRGSVKENERKIAIGSENSTSPRDGNEHNANGVDMGRRDLDSQIAELQETSEVNSSFKYGGELGQIAEEAARCERCNLCLTRENTVFGVGTENPLLMIVTAAPVFGAKEIDGPLSQYEFDYLDKWLRALELRPGLDTFITPAVKCRTPGGRPPNAEELGECFQYLKRQLTKLEPKAILALGAVACSALTGDISAFPSIVGKVRIWDGVPSLALWTPAEVLENPVRLRKPVWEALQELRDAWNALPRTGV